MIPAIPAATSSTALSLPTGGGNQKLDPKRREAHLPSVEESLCTKLLPFVLSAVAGSVDIIGFLALDRLFTAHITGNIVILAARFLADGAAPVAHVLSVPVFMVALILTRLLAAGLERLRFASLVPLLMLHFLLLSAFLVIGASAGPRFDPTAAMMVLAGMLGVSAMAVQYALVQISLTGAPSTAVMTTNISIFTMDVGEMLLARDPIGVAKAKRRAMHTWPAIVGFLVGCALGALGEAVTGLRSLALPAGLALLALALGIAATLHPAQSSSSIHKDGSA